MNPWEHRDVLADPHVVAYHRVPLKGELFQGGGYLLPSVAHEVEGVGGDAVHPVVGPVHHKLNAPGNGAELADDELVPQERIVMGDMVLKLLRTVDVIVVGVLPYLDIGSGDDVFQKTDLFDRLVGVDGVGVWPVRWMLFQGLGAPFSRARISWALVSGFTLGRAAVMIPCSSMT